MAVKSERKFGDIPYWAKQGPITGANYSYRAEQHCAASGRDSHPTIKRGMASLDEWWEYFGYLGQIPVAFQRIIDDPNSEAEFTVPEERPQWFDHRFVPQGEIPMEKPKHRPFVPANWANVLVRKDDPQYGEMVARAQHGSAHEFRHAGDGIWVAETWLKPAGYMGRR
jgi:hypothetical protein